jgi:hypothetical protein
MVNFTEETTKESKSTKYSSSQTAVAAATKKSRAELHRRGEIDARLITT